MTTSLPTDTDLAALLGQQAARSGTGLLTAVRGKLKRVFCVERGRLVYAASNVIEEQFPERLVRDGVVTPAERATATERSKSHGKPTTSVLLAVAGLSEEDARGAFERHVLDLVDQTLRWPDGEFGFEAGRPKLDGELTVSIPVVHVLLAHTRRYPARIEDVLGRIGPPDTRPILGSHADRILDGVEIDESARWVLSRADGTRPVTQLTKDAPGDPDAAIRSLYALMLAGAMETAGDAGGPTGKQMPKAGRDEILGWLARAEGADYYAVLGLDRSADQDAVRSAYYRIARRMHPDRFRTGDNSDLLERVERFFTRVTEAYNTLFDPEGRKKYDRLAEQEGKRGAEETAQTDPRYLARQNFLRGRALVEKRRYAEAMSFLENAIRLDESQSEYHLELGRTLIGNPRFRAAAEERLRRAAELDPSNAETYVALGELYERFGRQQEAVAAYREALRWEPGFEKASERLRALGG